MITSYNRGRSAGTLRQDWVVDDYFETRLRVTNWLGGDVQKYHRPERCRVVAEQVHLFTLFWAPLPALPPIHASQRAWLDYLLPRA